MQVKSKCDLKVKRVCRRGKLGKEDIMGKMVGATTRFRVDMDMVIASVIRINCQLILYEQTDLTKSKKYNNDNQ